MTSVQTPSAPTTPAGRLRVIRRDGSAVAFDSSRVGVALTKAFLAVEGSDAIATARIRAAITELTDAVEAALTRGGTLRRPVHVEDIQDQVELALMRAGHHRVARSYVLYREAHPAAQERFQGVKGLLDRVEQARLVPVEGLDRECHSPFGGVVGHRFQSAAQLCDRVCSLVRVHPPHSARSGGEGPGHRGGVKAHGNVHAVAQVVLGARPMFGQEQVAPGAHRPDDPG